MLLSPAGARVVTIARAAQTKELVLLSPAGARVVTNITGEEVE